MTVIIIKPFSFTIKLFQCPSKKKKKILLRIIRVMNYLFETEEVWKNKLLIGYKLVINCPVKTIFAGDKVNQVITHRFVFINHWFKGLNIFCIINVAFQK